MLAGRQHGDDHARSRDRRGGRSGRTAAVSSGAFQRSGREVESNDLKTGRVMVKDEDVCLHCGLCAERCPTGAWDMRKYYMEMAQAEHVRHKH